MTSLSDWSQFKFESLPTEVLKQIQLGALQELQKRRAVESTAHHRAHKTYRFKPGKFFHPAQIKRIDDLMREDWSELYPRTGGEACFYVYAHIAPGGTRIQHDGDVKLDWAGMPFYIGKGTGQRAWDLNRNEGHGQELRQLKARGVRPEQIVHIVKDGLTEAEALETEAKLIHFFGTRFQQERRGMLVNLTVPPRPQ